jgi:hypothetical protein
LLADVKETEVAHAKVDLRTHDGRVHTGVRAAQLQRI